MLGTVSLFPIRFRSGDCVHGSYFFVLCFGDIGLGLPKVVPMLCIRLEVVKFLWDSKWGASRSCLIRFSEIYWVHVLQERLIIAVDRLRVSPCQVGHPFCITIISTRMTAISVHVNMSVMSSLTRWKNCHGLATSSDEREWVFSSNLVLDALLPLLNFGLVPISQLLFYNILVDIAWCT